LSFIGGTKKKNSKSPKRN